MSSTYKVIYFDIRGLGELPRLILKAAGQDFTDERMPFSFKADGTLDKGDWDARKKTMPYGQVPVLEVDGQQIAQSGAIVRFLAKRFNMMGSDDLEAALIDAQYEARGDLYKAMQTAKPDAAKLAEFWSKGLIEQLSFINKNVQGELWMAKSNVMSYADIALYYLLYVFGRENKEAVEAALATAPKVKAICEAVPKNEKIAAWLAVRKETAW